MVQNIDLTWLEHIRLIIQTLLPCIFILVQSALFYGLWTCFVSNIIDSSNVFIASASYLWIFFYIYTFISYSAASFMSPGYVSLNWLREVENDPNYKEELTDNGDKNFCEKCFIPRPSRSHHCKKCRKCILLMDHHCFFISNCVGHRNFRAFFIFLWVFLIDEILSFIVVIYGMILLTLNSKMIFLITLTAIYYLLFGTNVLMQLFTQVKFACNNYTWIEYTIDQSQEETYQRFNVPMVRKYDTGSYFQNLKIRLGNHPYLWLIPAPNNSNSYYFPINPRHIPVCDLYMYSLNHNNNHHIEDELNFAPNFRNHVLV